MRKLRIAPNEHYHLYNRGNRGQGIFLDENDWSRFLFLILYCQSPLPVSNIGHRVKLYIKHERFSLYDVLVDDIAKRRYVELVNFTLMSNHFHLTIKETEEHGIARYMQRVLNAYTKYFNTKYKKEGHLFQGPFQAVHVKTNEQLLYLSTYIHKNPRAIREWRDKEEKYPYGSLQDYVKENRWGKLLCSDIVLGQFKTSSPSVILAHAGIQSSRDAYKKFVADSPAKTLEEKLDAEHLIED
ncbi:MAG: transposase [bacterium]|nr:transposase [bacterium]